MHNVFAPMASPDALFFFTSSSTSSSSHLHEETSTCDNFAAWNPGEDQDHAILQPLMMATLKKWMQPWRGALEAKSQLCEKHKNDCCLTRECGPFSCHPEPWQSHPSWSTPQCCFQILCVESAACLPAETNTHTYMRCLVTRQVWEHEISYGSIVWEKNAIQHEHHLNKNSMQQ